MKNIVIAGTSGVGKTFLEQELEKAGLTFQLPKYTNRPSRPGENSNKTLCLAPPEFEALNLSDAFFFTLDYGGYNYGWKRIDLLAHVNLASTLAITLKDLARFLSNNREFLPVLLVIDDSDLPLLEKRLYAREKFKAQTVQKQNEIKAKIGERLRLARQEIRQNDDFRKLVKSYRGLVFSIKDDLTIFDEVIPEIKKSLGKLF